MKKSYLLIPIACISISFEAFSQQKQDLRNTVNQKADAIEQQVINWRRDFHANPELGNREIKTAEKIATFLRSLGLEVKTGVAKTGVVALLKGAKPGPTVGLRADIDALPVTERTPVAFASKIHTIYNGQDVGVMHACGHDSHTAILMGVAEILTSMKDQLHGNVKFIFQPAEEGVPPGEVGGAEQMVKEGVLENPHVDVIFGLHINSQTEAGTITYRPGAIMAGVNDMKIVVKGKGAHGAAPWSSVDPVVTAAQIITSLQTVVSRNIDITENPAIVTIGGIKGGTRFNIIPEEVELIGTIRTFTAEDDQLTKERIKTIATKTAESMGATADVKIPFSASYPVTFNDPALTALMLPSLQLTAGEDNVILRKPMTGSEDFSFFAKKVPGLYFFLGGMEKGKKPEEVASHHTADFYIDESGFKLGVKALANLTIDYMNKTAQ
ncbi:amidohydrolase [Solitalea longa]|uniref:Amidohydrolase n=1 Tax=Solitalea longa TaxID=2079460 RepID=A0A2S5A3L6_9SPHI|nr:amidohydrolase [Solitalea longa]POY36907.1 amidohydrolase [Solitalea longa]